MNILYTSWILNLNRITRIIIWAFFGCSSTKPISGWHLVAPQLEQTKEKNHWKETHLWAFRSGPMADTLSEFFFFFFLFVAPHSMWHCLAFLLMGCFAVFYDFSHPSTAKQWTGLNWTFPCHSNSYISFVRSFFFLFFFFFVRAVVVPWRRYPVPFAMYLYRFIPVSVRVSRGQAGDRLA